MVAERPAVQRIEDESGEWRDLAFAFGSLFAHAHSEPVDDHTRGGERLVGLMVHELRTPVAIIKAYAELLEAQAGRGRMNGSTVILALPLTGEVASAAR
jgi:signal transduction histidine kinase